MQVRWICGSISTPNPMYICKIFYKYHDLCKIFYKIITFQRSWFLYWYFLDLQKIFEIDICIIVASLKWTLSLKSYSWIWNRLSFLWCPWMCLGVVYRVISTRDRLSIFFIFYKNVYNNINLLKLVTNQIALFLTF